MKESKFTWIDWIILGFAIGSIITSLLLLLFTPEIMNPLSTFLFQLLTLILGVYIAFRITTISVMNKTIELQKNTAKTSIRHIRGYQWNVEALIEMIKKKISDFTDNKLKDSLTEINHHLVNLSIGISLSENDFKDILGEEFKEEHLLITKLNNDLDLLNRKVNEVKKLSKKKEQTDKERISALETEILELKKEISSDINRFPISYSISPEMITPFPSGVTRVLGNSVAKIVTGASFKLPPIKSFSFKPERLADLMQREEENQNKDTKKTAKTEKEETKKK